MLQLPLTPKSIFWETAGRSLPRPGLKTNWRKPPARALRKLLQSRSASSSPRRWLGELTPQLPSAGKWFCTLLAALTCRIHPGSRELRPPPPRTEDSEHDILFQIPRVRHITPQLRAMWPGVLGHIRDMSPSLPREQGGCVSASIRTLDCLFMSSLCQQENHRPKDHQAHRTSAACPRPRMVLEWKIRIAS